MTDKCYAVVVVVGVAAAVNVVSVHDLHSVKISSVRLPRACGVFVCVCVHPLTLTCQRSKLIKSINNNNNNNNSFNARKL